MNTKAKGDRAVGQAISYFLKNDYEVLLPIGDKRSYDIVVEKNNSLQRVQVKFAGTYSDGKCKAGLRITGGNQRILYAKKYSPTDFDLLFIHTETDKNFLIPWEILKIRNELTIDDKKYIKYKV